MEHEIGGRGQRGLQDLSLGPPGLYFHSLDKEQRMVVWTKRFICQISNIIISTLIEVYLSSPVTYFQILISWNHDPNSMGQGNILKTHSRPGTEPGLEPGSLIAHCGAELSVQHVYRQRPHRFESQKRGLDQVSRESVVLSICGPKQFIQKKQIFTSGIQPTFIQTYYVRSIMLKAQKKSVYSDPYPLVMYFSPQPFAPDPVNSIKQLQRHRRSSSSL